MPSHVTTYLVELAQNFNAYYAQNKVIGSEEEEYRLALTQATIQTLKNGLYILGIKLPSKM